MNRFGNRTLTAVILTAVLLSAAVPVSGVEEIYVQDPSESAQDETIQEFSGSVQEETTQEIPFSGQEEMQRDNKMIPEEPGDIPEEEVFSGGDEVSEAEEAEGNEDLLNVPVPVVSYQTHVQNIGWQDYVKDGALSGTTGKSLRLEGLRVKVEGVEGLGIEYRAHVQNIGWQGYVADNDMAGTSGRSLRLEAVNIRLTGEAARDYDVYYCVHVQNYGWLAWTKNGGDAGSAGYAYRLEGIRIRILPKGSVAPEKEGLHGTSFYSASDGPSADSSIAGVAYNTHVQDHGWQEYSYNGGTAGTSGQSKRLEGIHIRLAGQPYPGGITYRAHVQDIGWQGWKSDGGMAGTSGQSKRLESIEIRLTGGMSEKYDVYYRTHVQTYGWLDWAENGQMAGTSGLSLRMEAIQIRLVPKGGEAPGPTARPSLVFDGRSKTVTSRIYSLGRSLSEVIPGLTRDRLLSWLGSHENDGYYRGTPYPQRANGTFILGRNGDCDNRNPKGDCGSVCGTDDSAGAAYMNCTGFVWHALWKASGMSRADGIGRIPSWSTVGAGDWPEFIRKNGIEHMTLQVSGDKISDLIEAAVTAKGPDGDLYLQKGDIIWFWTSPLAVSQADGLPAVGQPVPQTAYDECHVGIYWPSATDRKRWWDSIGLCRYLQKAYLQNDIHGIAPAAQSSSMTIVKTG